MPSRTLPTPVVFLAVIVALGTTASATHNGETYEGFPPAVPAVTFQDQTSNGEVVVVDSVHVPQDGFVVVMADVETESSSVAEPPEEFTTIPEEPGPEPGGPNETFPPPTPDENETLPAGTLPGGGGEIWGGSDWLVPGSHSGVIVPLDRYEPGETRLTAILFQDTDGDQTFDPDEDQPYKSNARNVTQSANVTFDEDAAGPAAEAPRDVPAPHLLATLVALALAIGLRRRG